jgi:hypothetical protein
MVRKSANIEPKCVFSKKKSTWEPDNAEFDASFESVEKIGKKVTQEKLEPKILTHNKRSQKLSFSTGYLLGWDLF